MKYEVRIVSESPYMQDRMDDIGLNEWEKLRGKIIERAGVNVEDSKKAEFACYRNTDGKCYIPKEHIKGALIDAGSYHKSKVGSKSKSMTTIVAGMFRISPAELIVPDYDKIDKRSVVNNNVKGRVMKTRPQWTSWEVTFILDTGDDHFTDELLVDIINTAGRRCGIGSFRVNKKGEFGQFKVESFKTLKETAKPPRK
jgi:hypothetical protein